MTSLALAVPLTAASVLGLLLNVYILFVVLVTRQVHTANNLLLLHLGAVDALLCLTFLVFSAPEMLEGWAWVAFSAPCNLHGFLFTLLHPVALWTICGLNCDRYYAITSPLHYGSVVNPKKVVIGLGVTWLVSLLLCIPPLFLVAPYRFDPGLAGCAPDFGQKEGSIWYSLAYTTFALLLPAVLILGSNLRVLTIARYHRHRIASAIFEVAISAQVTITHQRNPFFLPAGNPFRGRSAVSTVLQLIGSFLILYFPYYGVILWEASSSILFKEWNASSNRFHPIMVTLASTLLNCSPPINGLLYGVRSKALRKSFQNYWRKQMSRNEMNQEIQARTPSTCGSRRPSLTALGFLSRPASSHLQRRSSDLSLDHSASGRRAAQERRPDSASVNDTERLQTSDSFRSTVLQIRSEGSTPESPSPNCQLFKAATSKRAPRDRASRHGLYLHKRLGSTRSRTGAPPAPRGKSPRILVTRAFSEEDGDRLESRLELTSRSCSTIALGTRRKRLGSRDEDDGNQSDTGGTANASRPRSQGSSTTSDEDDTGRVGLSAGGSSSEHDIVGRITFRSAGEASTRLRPRDLPQRVLHRGLPNSSWPGSRRKANLSIALPGSIRTKSAANLKAAAAEFQL